MLAPDSKDRTIEKALLVIKTNQRRLRLLGGDDVYSQRTLREGGEAAVGMVLAVPWHRKSNPESDFVKNSIKLWKYPVNWRTAMSYDAAQVLIKALKDKPTRCGVQEAISASDFSATGASGIIKFSPEGNRRNAPIQLVEVRASKDSPTGYDFFPLPSN
jgi:branched-chain amino acid transport system substrate-binding protein